MTMEHKIYWSVGMLSVLIFVASFFVPGKPVSQADLPWMIEHPTVGVTRVFNLTLGSSTVNDAERHFREEAKLSMFKSPQNELAVEAFFEQVILAELKARVVIGIAVPEVELRDMYERGVRISGVESGKKITLAPQDATRVRVLPISSLTYMPSARLSEETLIKRFGQPSSQIHEKKSGLVHWLYPRDGLDITLEGEGKAVMQFVAPDEFGKLLQPLQVTERAGDAN